VFCLPFGGCSLVGRYSIDLFNCCEAVLGSLGVNHLLDRLYPSPNKAMCVPCWRAAPVARLATWDASSPSARRDDDIQDWLGWRRQRADGRDAAARTADGVWQGAS
jgi:hypothetical protein